MRHFHDIRLTIMEDLLQEAEDPLTVSSLSYNHNGDPRST